MKNLVFISGPQGAGKSTLIEKLRGPDIIISDFEIDLPKPDSLPFERQKLKISQKVLEGAHNLTLSVANPDKTVIGNRCIYDVLTYNTSFRLRFWYGRDEEMMLNQLAREMFSESLISPFAIVLNPGYKVVRKHLEERWAKKGKKWREDDEMYLKIVCQEYGDFRHKSGIFYIYHEVNLNSDGEIASLRRWING